MWQLTSNDQNHVIVWGPHKYNIGKPESFQKNVTVNIERQVSAVILSFIERVTFNPLLPWKRTLLPWLQVLQEKKTTKYAQTRWTVCADDRKKIEGHWGAGQAWQNVFCAPLGNTGASCVLESTSLIGGLQRTWERPVPCRPRDGTGVGLDSEACKEQGKFVIQLLG